MPVRVCLQLEARRSRPTAAKERKRSSAPAPNKEFVTGKFNFTKQPLLLVHHPTSQLLEEANVMFLLGATESLLMPVLSPIPPFHDAPRPDSQLCSQADGEVPHSVGGVVSLEHNGPPRPCIPQLSARGTAQVQKKPCVTEEFSSSPLQQLEVGVSSKTQI